MLSFLPKKLPINKFFFENNILVLLILDLKSLIFVSYTDEYLATCFRDKDH